MPLIFLLLLYAFSAKAQTINISVSPLAATVSTGQLLQFTAKVTPPKTSVTWKVNGVAGGNTLVGRISSKGLYSAPLTLPSPASQPTMNVTVAVAATSNAAKFANATVTITSTATITHSVTLNWIASVSTDVVGYNAYRSGQSGGPYVKINGLLTTINGTSFIDSAVQSGQTYYYVCTAVSSSNAESVYSNEAQATIPVP